MTDLPITQPSLQQQRVFYHTVILSVQPSVLVKTTHAGREPNYSILRAIVEEVIAVDLVTCAYEPNGLRRS